MIIAPRKDSQAYRDFLVQQIATRAREEILAEKAVKTAEALARMKAR
jgi:hypothetical protein